ncbi:MULTISPECIES: transglycosylase domain-containing protein [Streptomyces]|uniref:Multimodular transpeptidase-transglycosylase n=3 Tax=Streptomyces venezuelae TaxID=54571 RepID=F2R1A0_STRVP|nr:transglycosylase domain-containing protein [Streptomyces venezuelae]APE23652.1 penicillin-binding protein [Streptomyces venezuelae]QES01027.1 penicillin-binding protein [Streptomyces venezuelae ATCC 10712]CCA57991.1 Multimodular transpeptidase-transglycosylase [Streptomyces venezuelae ATCC 10712]
MGRPDKGKAKKRGLRRLFSWKKLLGTFFVCCLLAMGALYAVYLMVPVPTANAEATMQSNIYKYANGKILARTGKINREIVGLERIPEKVQKAFVAAENKTFYRDNGVDIKGTTRAAWSTITGKGKQGGSTITQQYVKNYYLSQDQTATRKLKEMVIAIKVDQQKSKSDILAGYMNTSYYGRSAYGIQAAARSYYGVDATQLTTAQGAYLASLLQAPNQYDWTSASPTGRKLVEQRWNYVLDNMVGEGWLPAAERAGMKFPVPQKPKPAPGMEGQTGYIVEAANQELVRQGVSEEDIKAGGWTITLNIDEKKQKDLVKAVDKQLEAKLDRKGDKKDATVQAGATSVDPKTGAVVALYGGVGATEHWTSNATRRDYQPASTFKPLVLASAIDNRSQTQDGRRIGLGTIYDGTSKRKVVGSSIRFAPENEDNASYGPVTVQKATNSSINSVYAQMIVDVGTAKTKKTALALGMKDGPDFGETPAMSLGTMGASTMDMAGVYATLDNHGEKVTPTLVKSAVHRDRTVTPTKTTGEQVISREAADTVTKAMTGVVQNGSGFRAAGDYEAAGKTGTSENNRSAWFVGYTPELVTAVGLFGEDAKGNQVTLTDTINPGRANGGRTPAEIWGAYTTSALGGGSDASFDLETDGWGGPDREPTSTPSTGTTDEPTEAPTTDAPDPTPTTTPPATTPPVTRDPITTPPPPTTTPPTTEPAPPTSIQPPDGGGEQGGDSTAGPPQ